jgi:hypothetical protein
VSVFGSGDYNRKKIVLVVCLAGCAVVSVFGSGGKLAVFLLWRESFITTRKKKFQSSGNYDWKKKFYRKARGNTITRLFDL